MFHTEPQNPTRRRIEERQREVKANAVPTEAQIMAAAKARLHLFCAVDEDVVPFFSEGQREEITVMLTAALRA